MVMTANGNNDGNVHCFAFVFAGEPSEIDDMGFIENPVIHQVDVSITEAVSTEERVDNAEAVIYHLDNVNVRKTSIINERSLVQWRTLD